MKNLLEAKTKSGKIFNVRLLPISINDEYRSSLNTRKAAEIEIGGKWYECYLWKVPGGLNNLPVAVVSKNCKELQDAVNIPLNMRDKDMTIVLTTNWEILYTDILKEAELEFAKLANETNFTYITFTYHTTHKYFAFNWDSKLHRNYINYNNHLNNFINSLEYIKPVNLNEYQTGSDLDDYSSEMYFKVNIDDIDKITQLSTPELTAARLDKEKKENKEENIKNGAIYFNCESKPHNEDLSSVILNSPAPPKNGIFTISHRIDKSLFARIAKFGKYWDKEWLEECDMFFTSPGYRYSLEAIKEIKKTNRVFIDNEEII